MMIISDGFLTCSCVTSLRTSCNLYNNRLHCCSTACIQHEVDHEGGEVLKLWVWWLYKPHGYWDCVSRVDGKKKTTGYISLLLVISHEMQLLWSHLLSWSTTYTVVHLLLNDQFHLASNSMAWKHWYACACISTSVVFACWLWWFTLMLHPHMRWKYFILHSNNISMKGTLAISIHPNAMLRITW